MSVAERTKESFSNSLGTKTKQNEKYVSIYTLITNVTLDLYFFLTYIFPQKVLMNSTFALFHSMAYNTLIVVIIADEENRSECIERSLQKKQQQQQNVD